MSSEQHDIETANSSDEPAQAPSVPRWATVAALLIVSLALLILSSMMLVMGWFGPPMHGGRVGPDPDIFMIAGLVLSLLAIGTMYGVYRLYAVDKE